tara:strand:+ start:349 stop:996 length:648 start_codon:yes stop_codon:yes gene_type:complete
MVSLNQTTISKITEKISELSLQNFSLTDYITTIQPLIIFVLGVTAYSLFVFKFYKFLSRRDIVKLKLEQYKEGFLTQLKRIGKTLFNLIENIILTPICIIFWFAVLTTFMFLLSKNPDVDSIILTSMALVASIRITAHYNENLSQDLAKMVPFALLGVFLIDINYFSFQNSLETIKQIPLFWSQLGYYLIFVISLETVLRIITTLIRIIFSKSEH